MIGLAFCLAVSGCGQSRVETLETENADLRDQVDQLQTQLSNIKDKASSLKSASDDLQSQMARFQSENWRDVVPDAQQSSDSLESAQTELQDATDE
jgi:cell division septum initiation protein DivIVA